MRERDWKPIEGWEGRFQCTKTLVVGYRRGVMYRYLPEMTDEESNEVVPYVCAKAGCAKPAIFADPKVKKRRYCSEHLIFENIEQEPDEGE